MTGQIEPSDTPGPCSRKDSPASPTPKTWGLAVPEIAERELAGQTTGQH